MATLYPGNKVEVKPPSVPVVKKPVPIAPAVKQPIPAVKQPEVKKPEVKTQEQILRECLINLRDNVVHGNEAHVRAINAALGSK